MQRYTSSAVSEWVDQCVDRPRVMALLHAIVRLATYTNAPRDLSAEIAIRQLQLALGEGTL